MPQEPQSETPLIASKAAWRIAEHYKDGIKYEVGKENFQHAHQFISNQIKLACQEYCADKERELNEAKKHALNDMICCNHNDKERAEMFSGCPVCVQKELFDFKETAKTQQEHIEILRNQLSQVRGELEISNNRREELRHENNAIPELKAIISELAKQNHKMGKALLFIQSQIGIGQVDKALTRILDSTIRALQPDPTSLTVLNKSVLQAASDQIDFDQENKCAVCHCCGMELDDKGKGHKSDCLADLILSNQHENS